MRTYLQIHCYPLLIGWLNLHAKVIGEPGRTPRGEPYEYRIWERCDYPGPCACKRWHERAGL